MFVLVSIPIRMDPNKYKMSTILLLSTDEYVLGLYSTKELAIQAIPAYSGTIHSGKAAIVYEMLPDGDKQKRVKIYEGTVPLHAPKLSNSQESSLKNMQLIADITQRLQKLEEKLEAKCAECIRLKTHNDDLTKMMTEMINRIKSPSS
jgi:hypothetical protein